MEYYTNHATVKRYKKQRKSKAKNPKQPTTEYETVTIDLGNQSEFKHKQNVVVIATEDYNSIMEELNTLRKHAGDMPEITEPTKEDPTIIDNVDGHAPGNITNEELHQQLLAMDNDRIQLVNVQKQLDYYKSMAIDWNGQLLGIESIFNKLIDEVIQATKEQYDIVIDQTMEENKQALKSLLKTIETIDQENREAYQQHNIAIAGNIDEIVNATNNEIRNTSTWQMIRHKKDINLHVPTSDLKEAPQTIKKLELLNNAHVLDKLQSKPNFGHVNINDIKHNLVNIPNVEELKITSRFANNDMDL